MPLVFLGILITKDLLFLYKINYTTKLFFTYRYAFEGILQAIYDGNREKLQCYEIYCHLRSPKKILEEMDMPTISYYTIILSLCLWISCLQIITYLILKWKTHKAK